MSDIWFISDTHFNHANILTFKTNTPDGELIRPGFKDVDHMNEVMIENWNKVVKPGDKIYHLGDVSFGNEAKYNAVMRRLNGRKRLILGNHDNFDMSYYQSHFQKIYSWRSFGQFSKAFICCHYPLHTQSFQYRKSGPGWCVHGHIHEKLVRKENKDGTILAAPDPRYINVCVEQRNYTPIHLDELLKEMKLY
jgi:calcineurin-like phosphoesterase family protein